MLKAEDRGIDRVVILSLNQIRIASSTSIETLLQEDFKIHINDKYYQVHCPKYEKVTTEEVQRKLVVMLVLKNIGKTHHPFFLKNALMSYVNSSLSLWGVVLSLHLSLD
ncbi:hypothetical protein QE152_g38526 [Popillia japonica]|uniref:Uncharacterized protein n=1 Tax=Popillia japonica TaxID=7064 RepID=A0AAW1HWL5_POPJA